MSAGHHWDGPTTLARKASSNPAARHAPPLAATEEGHS